MSSRLEAWVSVEPAHLPHYSQTAATIGTVVLLAFLVFWALAMLAGALSQRADDTRPNGDRAPGDERTEPGQRPVDD
jgi:hypothetical protein